MDLALQRAAPKTTSSSSRQEVIPAPTSSEPAQHRQASASGNGRPLSQHSVGSHSRHLIRSARTEEEGEEEGGGGVGQEAPHEGGEGPNEGEEGVSEEVVEEIVEEVEDAKGDVENVSGCCHIMLCCV